MNHRDLRRLNNKLDLLLEHFNLTDKLPTEHCVHSLTINRISRVDKDTQQRKATVQVRYYPEVQTYDKGSWYGRSPIALEYLDEKWQIDRFQNMTGLQLESANINEGEGVLERVRPDELLPGENLLNTELWLEVGPQPEEKTANGRSKPKPITDRWRGRPIRRTQQAPPPAPVETRKAPPPPTQTPYQAQVPASETGAMQSETAGGAQIKHTAGNEGLSFSDLNPFIDRVLELKHHTLSDRKSVERAITKFGGFNPMHMGPLWTAIDGYVRKTREGVSATEAFNAAVKWYKDQTSPIKVGG